MNIPATIHPIDVMAVTNGPLIATSNNAVRDLGNDRRGVILPNVPICNEGMGTGHPILTSVAFAAT